jgi:hypothetical protein
MKFGHNKALSLTARKGLIKGLTKVAELYFNGEHIRYEHPDKVNIGCGICKALHDLEFSHSYHAMQELMQETNEYSYGQYVDTPEEWEPRANMCLFLVEYLKDTIKEKA